MLPRSSPIQVDVISGNARSRNTIEFAIARHSKGKLAVGHGKHSRLVVVDCDGPLAREELTRYHRQHPDRPVVLLLATENELGHYTDHLPHLRSEVLTKPLKLDGLISTIERCASRPPEPQSAPARPPRATETIQSTVVLPGGFGGLMQEGKKEPTGSSDATEVANSGTALARLKLRTGVFLKPLLPTDAEGDIDLADPAAVGAHRLCAASLLLGRLRAALKCCQEQTPLLARLDGWPLFRVLPAEQQVELLVPTDELPSLCTKEIAESDFSLTPAAAPMAAEPTHRFTLEGFLWRLALLTYQGRIPEDTDPNERVFLIWPNLTRLDPVPDGLRIAALLHRSPIDLAFASRVLRVPQRHVFLFYAAALTVGLAGRAKRASNYLFEPELRQGIMPRSAINRLAEHVAEGHKAGPDESQEIPS